MSSISGFGEDHRINYGASFRPPRGFQEETDSEPSRILQGLDYSLYLQVVSEAVDPLLPALSTHPVPSKGNSSIEHVVAVDPDGPNPERSGQGVGSVDILGENSCGKSIVGLVRPPDHLIEIPVNSKPNKNSEHKEDRIPRRQSIVEVRTCISGYSVPVRRSRPLRSTCHPVVTE